MVSSKICIKQRANKSIRIKLSFGSPMTQQMIRDRLKFRSRLLSRAYFKSGVEEAANGPSGIKRAKLIEVGDSHTLYGQIGFPLVGQGGCLRKI